MTGLASRWSIRRGPVAAGMLAVLLAAGCGDTRVPSDPDPGPAHTAVTPPQALQILDTVGATVVRAVQARDAAQFGGRAVGPARDAFSAAIAVQATLREAPSVPPSPGTPRLVLTLAGPWPRWFLAAGSSPASRTPLVAVLRSADPRSPYGLWGLLNLLPGATLPELASATVGAPTLAPTATGLVCSPADAVARYADLLNRGDTSAYHGQFTDDAFRAELTNQLGADRKAFESIGIGEVVSTHAVASQAPLAIATRDGGALVIARLDQRYAATVTPGRGSVTLDAELAALAGRAAVSTSLERRSVEVVALHVPKAGAVDKISLVAASRSDVSATGS
ncbi:MAG TPA: hypothetical protein VI248_03480 [Kineosporiaceae bacterium]